METRGAVVAKCERCDKDIFENDNFSTRYPRKGKTRSKTPVFMCADCAAEVAEAKQSEAEKEKRKEKIKRIIKIVLIVAGIVLVIIAIPALLGK